MPDQSLEIVKNHLEKSIGEIGVKLFKRSISKLKLSENPSRDEIGKLIAELENGIIPLYGNDKSKAIFEDLRKKLEKSDVPLSSNIDQEITSFASKNTLPTERDITDYAKYLIMKYGGNAQQVEKELVEKVRAHVKIGITRKKINEEISNFLTRYNDPQQKDIDDFVNYIRLSKLDYPENELRERIEKERLFLKFHGSHEEESSQLDRFIDFVRVCKDKNAVGTKMEKQGLSYLIKNESGVSDKSLSEFIELITPNEEDMRAALEGLGLDHMVKKK